jgi:AcrR family transcriptional regulator
MISVIGDQITGATLRFHKDDMKNTAAKTSTRKPRVDAARNRAKILEVAKKTFMRRGVAASMDEIAKGARIGPGTLYRHFPTRDDLIAAVYITEVEKLGEAQKRFSAELAPVDALRAWMLVVIDYIVAKKIILPALHAMAGGPSGVFEESTRVMEAASSALGSRAVASKDLRPDVDPMDMLRAIYGISSTGGGDDWPERARRFVDILIQGSRP